MPKLQRANVRKNKAHLGTLPFPAPQPRQEFPVPGLRASYIVVGIQSANHDLLYCPDRPHHVSGAAWTEDLDRPS